MLQELDEEPFEEEQELMVGRVPEFAYNPSPAKKQARGAGLQVSSPTLAGGVPLGSSFSGGTPASKLKGGSGSGSGPATSPRSLKQGKVSAFLSLLHSRM